MELHELLKEAWTAGTYRGDAGHPPTFEEWWNERSQTVMPVICPPGMRIELIEMPRQTAVIPHCKCVSRNGTLILGDNIARCPHCQLPIKIGGKVISPEAAELVQMVADGRLRPSGDTARQALREAIFDIDNGDDIG